MQFNLSYHFAHGIAGQLDLNGVRTLSTNDFPLRHPPFESWLNPLIIYIYDGFEFDWANRLGHIRKITDTHKGAVRHVLRSDSRSRTRRLCTGWYDPQFRRSLFAKSSVDRVDVSPVDPQSGKSP